MQSTRGRQQNNNEKTPCSSTLAERGRQRDRSRHPTKCTSSK